MIQFGFSENLQSVWGSLPNLFSVLILISQWAIDQLRRLLISSGIKFMVLILKVRMSLLFRRLSGSRHVLLKQQMNYGMCEVCAPVVNDDHSIIEGMDNQWIQSIKALSAERMEEYTARLKLRPSGLKHRTYHSATTPHINFLRTKEHFALYILIYLAVCWTSLRPRFLICCTALSA